MTFLEGLSKSRSQERSQEWLRYGLVAAATATAAGAASSCGRSEGFGRAAGDTRAKHGKLDCGFFAGAFGAGDFLLFIEDEFFEWRFAIVADVFVDGHSFVL